MNFHISGATRAPSVHLNAGDAEYHNRSRRSRIDEYLRQLLVVIVVTLSPVVGHGDHNNPTEPGYRVDRTYSHWMKDNWEIIKNRPLRDLVIPGSHDAGTYVLGSIDLSLAGDPFVGSDPNVDNFFLEYCVELVAIVKAAAPFPLPDFECTDLATAQGMSIYEQLHRGSRYLDLRFVEVDNELTGRSEMRIHHTYIGPKHTEIFNDILRFLEEPGNEKEVIILELKNFGGRGTFNEKQHKKFLEILTPLAGYMYADPGSEFNTTLEQIVCEKGATPDAIACSPSGKQLIVFHESRGNGDPDDETGLTPYGTSENLLWKGKIRTNLMGRDPGAPKPKPNACDGVEDKYPDIDLLGGCSDYPNPTLWQSEDLLANLWMENIPITPRPLADSSKPLVNSLAIGANNDLSVLTNTVDPDPDVIGWVSLEEISEFTNPRTIPHIIARPKDQVNIVAIDYFGRDFYRFMPEIIKLNQDPAPARVTIEVVSVQIRNISTDCGQGVVGDTKCDFYPIFEVNGNESEEPEDSLSYQHQRGNVIDNDNYVKRDREIKGNLWTYTVAVPWTSDLFADLTIYDDDPEDGLGLNTDDLVATTKLTPGLLVGKLRELSNNGTDTDNIYFTTTSDATIGTARVVYNICIQTWNSEVGKNACDAPAWSIDLAPPFISCDTPDGTWHADNVSIACSATDNESSLENPDDADFLLWTSEPPGTETDNAITNSREICDANGNCAMAGPIGGNWVDRKAPTIVPPSDMSVEATALITTVNIGNAEVSDGGSGVQALTNDANPPDFPLGTTTVRWTAVDNVGNASFAEQLITVVDTTPPTIHSLSATPSVLWPPNKKMRPVSVAIDVNDLVDESPSCELVDIQVNQSAPPGKKRGALYEITGSTSALLLADRNGPGGDRRYTLRVSCTDFSGNTSSATTDVVVPHDSRH